jgi:spermidine synthase
LCAPLREDPRVKIVCQDASEYVKDQKDRFDIIIVDSTDPVGPAATLFEKHFYQSMFHALRPEGKICTQAECIWLHLDLVSTLMMDSKNFLQAEYASTQVPTYPCGQIGFFLGSKGSKKSSVTQNLDSLITLLHFIKLLLSCPSL